MITRASRDTEGYLFAPDDWTGAIANLLAEEVGGAAPPLEAWATRRELSGGLGTEFPLGGPNESGWPVWSCGLPVC